MKFILRASIFFIFSCLFVYPNDKPTLDALVSKGILSADEANVILKESVEIVPMKKEVKSLRLSGRVQTQYENISVEETIGGVSENIGTRSDFVMRRIFLGLTAELGGGWTSNVVADFCRSKDGYLEYAYITKEIDNTYLYGILDLGYKKVNFNLEEYMSSSSLMSIERSLASRYFSETCNGRRLGLGGRHTGVFWRGKVPQIGGLAYGFSASNSFNNNPVSIPENASSAILFCFDVSYKYSFDDGVITFGANLAYSDNANVEAPASSEKKGSIVGVNPYVRASFCDIELWGEFLFANFENSNLDRTKDSAPMGMNIGVEYKIDIGEWGTIAPTARFSWLDTDGRGIKMSDGVRNAPVRSTFDNGCSFYLGVNWYIIGNTVKLQLGYEYARLEDSPQSNSLNQYSRADAVRGQLQFSF